jgi:hypothetical protein
MRSNAGPESGKVTRGCTAAGDANNDKFACAFGRLDTPDVTGSAVEGVKWQLGLSAQQE